MDAVLITECADPSLKPAIVEQFISTVGSGDPLAITVRSGGRIILIPKPKTPDEAMAIVRQHVGHAVVRVGITQFPAGAGVKDVSELKTDLVDPCKNLRMGTTMFARVLRTVNKWYGNPTNAEVFPQIFEDAAHAWNSGQFEGQSVFQAENSGRAIPNEDNEVNDGPDEPGDVTLSPSRAEAPDGQEIGTAGTRIDLSRINGQ